MNVSRPSISSGVAPEGLGHTEWAVRLLITQLYDPEVDVCETAVRILEEACNIRECLELVVKSGPALDHLGEIGAPLLLRYRLGRLNSHEMGADRSLDSSRLHLGIDI